MKRLLTKLFLKFAGKVVDEKSSAKVFILPGKFGKNSYLLWNYYSDNLIYQCQMIATTTAEEFYKLFKEHKLNGKSK